MLTETWWSIYCEWRIEFQDSEGMKGVEKSCYSPWIMSNDFGLKWVQEQNISWTHMKTRFIWARISAKFLDLKKYKPPCHREKKARKQLVPTCSTLSTALDTDKKTTHLFRSVLLVKISSGNFWHHFLHESSGYTLVPCRIGGIIEESDHVRWRSYPRGSNHS